MADGQSVAPAAGALARLYASAPENVAFGKLRKRLLRQAEDAIARYGMAAPAAVGRPRWLVCVSGGKDSASLLALLLDLKAQGRLDVDLLACNLDQGQPGFPKHVLPDWLGALGVPFRIETRDTYSTVIEKTPEGSAYCALCSRLRRGNLYRVAREEGCAAIVLGHHRDDALETFFMNLFNGGRLAAMAPKLLNDEGDLLVLRPLIDCAEDDLEKFAAAMRFPIIPCDLCSSQDGLEREAMRRLIDGLAASRPALRETMWRALNTVRPGQLADASLFDFAALAAPALAKRREQGQDAAQ